MQQFTYFWFLWAASVFYFEAGAAQGTSAPDSAWETSQTAHAAELYRQQFSGPNSPVFRGYQYVPFIFPATGDPFYPDGEWHEGTVDFGGKVYTGLFLLYDILKDQLVLQSEDKLYRILLSREKVAWFTLDSVRFIAVDNEKADDDIPSGYYEQAAEGAVELLVKRVKRVVIPVSGDGKRLFVAQNLFYIKKEDRYYKIGTKRTVLKVLSDRRRMVRAYLHKQHIWFGRNRENAIREAVSYYNKIKAGDL